MKPEEILVNIWEPSPFGSKYIEDLQLAITLNPDLDRIIEAMEKFAKQAFNASREEVKALSGPAGLKYQTFEDYLNSLEND